MCSDTALLECTEGFRNDGEQTQFTCFNKKHRMLELSDP